MDSMKITEEIYNENKDMVRRICASYENDPDKLEELCQNVWERAIGKADKFDGGSLFRTWLSSLTHNACKNHIRHEMVRNDVVADCDVDYEGEDGGTYIESSYDEWDTPEGWYAALEAVNLKNSK